MVSFDVTSVCTNVALDKAIEIILKRLYEKKERMKELHYLCMKELHYLCTKIFISLLIIIYTYIMMTK